MASYQSKIIHDKSGKEWHFELWMGLQGQSIFFWNKSKTTTGLMQFPYGKLLHWNKLEERMLKLAKDPEYRNQFLQPLKFPLKRNYKDA